MSARVNTKPFRPLTADIKKQRLKTIQELCVMDDMKQRPPLREPLPRHGALALLWAAGLATLLLPSGCSLVTMGGRMLLGAWQGLFLFEHRTRPQVRELVLHLA